MSELKGYKGKIRDFLTQNQVKVGDLIKITSELTFSGILMPRYESGDESHIVLKLKSGYNIGIEFEKIEKIEKIEKSEWCLFLYPYLYLYLYVYLQIQLLYCYDDSC